MSIANKSMALNGSSKALSSSILSINALNTNILSSENKSQMLNLSSMSYDGVKTVSENGGGRDTNSD